ncbi:MAG: PilZ domain-containing protein [Chitinispirillia bacterium]|jgi:c-di-GMP-binding flagellar brake protein YcgR
MFKNRRKHQRYPITVQVSVRFGDNFLEGSECSDISLGGMCVVVNDKISKNNNAGVVMLVQKCGEETVFFESDFVRLWDNLVYTDSNDTRLGIRFKNIDQKNFDSLCKILSFQEEENLKDQLIKNN